MDWWYWLIYVFWFVIGFAVLYAMAGSRGRNQFWWGIFGAIFFVIALVALLIAGPARDEGAPS